MSAARANHYVLEEVVIAEQGVLIGFVCIRQADGTGFHVQAVSFQG